MHLARVPGFDIEYDVDVSCQGGFDLSLAQMTIPGQFVEAVYVQPTSVITMSALGTIYRWKSNTENVPKSRVLKLGFAQTLLECIRKGYYQPHMYGEAHPAYPIKDGEGKPWFKLGKMNLLEVKSDEINPSKEFWIEVTDEPHCSFPLVCPFVHPVENLLGFDFHDSFKTCLLAEIYLGDDIAPGQPPEQQAFLHEVSWNFDVAGQYMAGRPGRLIPPGQNGYHHGGAGLAIPGPYARPQGIVLGGRSANSSKVCAVFAPPPSRPVRVWRA
jgi:hypothetical protein